MQQPEIPEQKDDTAPLADLACLSLGEMAELLRVDEQTLRKMHEQGNDAAPPRFRFSKFRWLYPVTGYRAWLHRRMQQEAADPLKVLPSRVPADSAQAKRKGAKAAATRQRIKAELAKLQLMAAEQTKTPPKTA